MIKKSLVFGLILTLAICIAGCGDEDKGQKTEAKIDRTNIETVFEELENVCDSGNEDKIIDFMFPKSIAESAKELVDNMQVMQNDFVKNAVNVDYTYSTLEDIEDGLKTEVANIFTRYSVDLSYEQIKKVGIESGNGEKTYIIAYRSENEWYFVPGMLEHVVKIRQEEDIDVALKIKNVIESAYKNESIRNKMKLYEKAVISLNRDMELLPTEFVTELTKAGIDFNVLKYTDNGAKGFSFKVSYEDNNAVNVEVYISSEENIDEWTVYPKVEDAYYTGEKDKENGTKWTEESFIAKLVGSNSPLMGYWQAGDAGMRIEYSLLGKDEGFSIYFISTKEYSKILCEKKDFNITGTADSVKFTSNGTNEEYKITVVDANNIIFKTPNNEYKFAKKTLNEEFFKSYVGKWVSSGDYYGAANTKYESVGNVCNMTYCKECNGIHDSKYDHSSKIVTIFDGKKLKSMKVSNNVFDNDSTTPDSAIEEYTVAGNKLEKKQLSGNGLNAVYFKEGAEELKCVEALQAYEKWFEENRYLPYANATCQLIYFNNDNIPELNFDTHVNDMGNFIVGYIGGECKEITGLRGWGFGYVKKQSICYEYDRHGESYSRYDDYGKYLETICCVDIMDPYGESPELDEYKVRGQICTREEYKKCADSMKVIEIGGKYNSIKEAWRALQDK